MANTILNQATAVSLQLTDYALLWQGGQSPSTRKMPISNLATYYLALTGGTVTGDITFSAAKPKIKGNAGTVRAVQLLTGSTVRWQIDANATAESGTNAGSDFELWSYTDAGAQLTKVLAITRSSGAWTFTGNGTITGTLGGLTGLTVASGGATVTSGGVTVTAGGVHITAGGATVTAGGLTVSAGGATIAGTTTVSGAFGVSGAQTTLTGSGTTGSTTGLAVQNFSGLLGFICSDNGGITIPRLASFTTGSAANMNWDGATGLVQLSTSSARYKRDITTFSDTLAAARKLRPVRFRSRAENDGDTVFAGLIAEEVHDAGLTEFVSYDQEGRPNAIHYGPLAALALGAVAELADALDALSARVAALEAKA